MYGESLVLSWLMYSVLEEEHRKGYISSKIKIMIFFFKKAVK
ncbi:hypothetical protein P689_11930 [Candidatus Riesia pediculischaeffi PTSU]|uniref:Uncharacterized protein n=1 Tax=Candidatus Riesia pediculischaeffi PTSU TaxID=1401651 RepID=A0A0C1V6I9_9ENTR|nr:hypothetical protein P689_11930 [Candidatus Riesia pediculischaeffi PTSU]